MAELVKGAVAGALGGILGTAFIKQELKLGARLQEKFQGPKLNADPAEFVTEKAEELAGEALPPKARPVVVKGLHWVYGSFWPVVAGLALRRSVFESAGKTLAVGAGLGAGVWAAGYLGWLPSAHLVDEKSQRMPSRQASAAISHILYGIVSVAPLYLASRFWPRRRGLLARLGVSAAA
jgi:hypothetical protein